MSELKCPSCGQELKRDYYDCEMLECHNPKCKHYYDDFIGREELWQELIRTRKALKLAKERLKNTILDAEVFATSAYLASRAKETLAEITALEQKDVK